MANSFAPPTDCTGASAGSWLLGRRAGRAGAPETAPDGARGLFPSPLRVGSCGAGGTAVPALALSLPEVAVGRVRLARGATWRPSSRPPPASGAATIPDINATRCRTISTARSTTARSDHRPSCSPTMPPSKASNVIEIRRKRRKRCRDSRSAVCLPGVEEIVLTTGIFAQQPIPIVPIVIFRKNRIPQDDTISIFSHFRLRSWRSSMLRLVQSCRRRGWRDDRRSHRTGLGSMGRRTRPQATISGDILLQGTDIHILRNTPDDVSTDMIGIGRTSKK